MLPTLLDAVPLEIRQVMWLQHDKLQHTLIEMWGITSTLHTQINGLVEGDQFHGQHDHQISHHWTIFLWGSMKALVYTSPVTSEEDLIARVHGTIEILSRQPHLLDHVRADSVDSLDSALT